MKPIRLVSATRKTPDEFFRASALGKSLQACKAQAGWKLQLFAQNARPLPVVYNEAIAACASDPAFAFHFYDLDFCRQAERRGLAMGTWPISIIHESGGAFGTPAWRSAYQEYLRKYRGDP